MCKRDETLWWWWMMRRRIGIKTKEKCVVDIKIYNKISLHLFHLCKKLNSKNTTVTQNNFGVKWLRYIDGWRALPLCVYLLVCWFRIEKPSILQHLWLLPHVNLFLHIYKFSLPLVLLCCWVVVLFFLTRRCCCCNLLLFLHRKNGQRFGWYGPFCMCRLLHFCYEPHEDFAYFYIWLRFFPSAKPFPFVEMIYRYWICWR